MLRIIANTAALLSALSVPAALACSCMPPDLEREWNTSAAIFTGKVVGVRVLEEGSSPFPSVEFTLKVERFFKAP